MNVRRRAGGLEPPVSLCAPARQKIPFARWRSSAFLSTGRSLRFTPGHFFITKHLLSSSIYRLAFTKRSKSNLIFELYHTTTTTDYL